MNQMDDKTRRPALPRLAPDQMLLSEDGMEDPLRGLRIADSLEVVRRTPEGWWLIPSHCDY
jgi:hypothetical protein